MKNDKPSDGALRAARLLRMKIHSMPPGKGVCEADNRTNSKWLDEVTVGDAELIDKETGLKELIEAGMIFSAASKSLLKNMPRTKPEEVFIWHHSSNVPGEAFGISLKDLISLDQALAKAKGE